MYILHVDDFYQAYFHWCEHYGITPYSQGPVFHSAFKTFAHLCAHDAVTWADGRSCVEVRIPDESKPALDLLLSPHWRTLLKAYDIAKGRK